MRADDDNLHDAAHQRDGGVALQMNIAAARQQITSSASTEAMAACASPSAICEWKSDLSTEHLRRVFRAASGGPAQ